MLFSDVAKVEQLRGLFEDRVALYVEKGASLVRVSNIRRDTDRLTISAEIEEIPTAGFPAGLFPSLPRDGKNPLRRMIESGFMSSFSDHTWNAGYGGWSLFFAQESSRVS